MERAAGQRAEVMKKHSATPAPKSARPSRIRGHRWVLFDVDLKRDAAWPLCMGRSRDWLMLLGRKLDCPSVVQIDAAEANSIARQGALPIDDMTIAALAGQCRVSKSVMAMTVKNILREYEAARRKRDESIYYEPSPSAQSGAARA